jgi:hypothetical protein
MAVLRVQRSAKRNLLLADPVKRLDKERDGILLIEQHGPAFLASSRCWLIASFDADSREGSKS